MAEALICPTCSAPLDYPAGGGASMRCPYCKTTVLLSADSKANIGTGEIPDAFRPMVEQALQMAQAAGKMGPASKIEAIKMFRASSGASLADAKKVIEAAGLSGASRTARPGNPAQAPTYRTTSKGTGVVIGVAIAIALFAGLGVPAALVARQLLAPKQRAVPSIPHTSMMSIPTRTPVAAPTFAAQVMAFGSEGVGPGRFKDNRTIAVDGQGHIYVGEYGNGRIQAFDSTGKYLSEWSVGKDKYLQSLSADRAGIVYAVADGHILRFTGATGAAIDEMENVSGDTVEDYRAASVAPNGDVYAIGGDSDIVVLNSEGKIKQIIKASQKIGEDVSLNKIVKLSTGEMFALDRQQGVFKFAEDGRYINRFGGGEGSGPGHLSSPQDIAVDGQGRIYVTDFGPSVRVYNGDGAFIDSFGDNQVAFGLAVNDRDETFVCFRNQHEIRKFVLVKR
jgi:LSD1 subclass zinc finger protein